MMADANKIVSEKPPPAIEELEDGTEHPKAADAALDAAAKGQATTGYEHLSIWETVKHFKVASLICFAAAFSAATDGYQIG